MARKLRLRADSRYTLTPLLQDGDDTFFATWVPPEIPISAFDTFYILQSQDVGRFDALAYRFYGNPELGWVIAHVNNIDDPFSVPAGSTVRVPLKINVIAALNL